MNALWRLEKGGIQFELTTEGQVTYKNTWPGELPDEWFRPLIVEVRLKRNEVVAILAARREWMEVYDEWCLADDLGTGDLERDIAYLERLEKLAIEGQLGCYDGEDVDLGAEGWELVTARILEDYKATFVTRPQTTDHRPRHAKPSSVVRRPSSGQTTSSQQKENDTMGIKIEQTTYDAVPTGEYKAVITSIESVEGKFGPQLQIKSEINTGPYAGNTFLCWVSPKFSPKSRLFEWVEAALAMPVPKSYTFDSDHLIGREVVATLVVRELDGGGEVNRVDRVRAVPKAQDRLPLAS